MSDSERAAEKLRENLEAIWNAAVKYGRLIKSIDEIPKQITIVEANIQQAKTALLTALRDEPVLAHVSVISTKTPEAGRQADIENQMSDNVKRVIDSYIQSVKDDRKTSKTIRCLVLDGFHKGHRVDVDTELQELVLLKPEAITIDDCCNGDVVGVDNDSRKFYKLAGYSVDRTVAMYSTDGTMESIFNRDWIVPAEKNWVETPIYMGIHDPRATVDYSTIEDES